MDGWLAWLVASAPAVAMRTSLWLYPIVEIVHILGFVVLVGAVAMFDLRLLGWGRALPVTALARHVLPWPAGALLLVVPAGLLLFSTQPAEFLANPAFRCKLVLVLLAGLNAALFHLGAFRHVARWDGGRVPLGARLHGLVSLALWVGVIACGRLIAYW